MCEQKVCKINSSFFSGCNNSKKLSICKKKNLKLKKIFKNNRIETEVERERKRRREGEREREKDIYREKKRKIERKKYLGN